MKKKITIIDKSFTPIVVLADTSSALYEDRCGNLGNATSCPILKSSVRRWTARKRLRP